jgi:hypothetical protein
MKVGAGVPSKASLSHKMFLRWGDFNSWGFSGNSAWSVHLAASRMEISFVAPEGSHSEYPKINWQKCQSFFLS